MVTGRRKGVRMEVGALAGALWQSQEETGVGRLF